MALASGAATIVSGDADLLVLHPWRGVRVLKPAAYLVASEGDGWWMAPYLERTGIVKDGTGPLFRTIGRGTARLTRTPLPQANAYAMIARRGAAGVATKIGNHSFRATRITAYLKNGGTLEEAAAMATHASTRTTQPYDRRHDEMSLDKVKRIRV